VKFLLFFILSFSFSFSATQSVVKWKQGQTYLEFLESYHLPLRTLYYNLDREDQKITEEILAGTRCELLLDDNKTLLQVLIPISNALQIQIYQRQDLSYGFTATPLVLDEQKEAFMFELRTSPYNDIMHYTKNRYLAQEFVWAYKNSLNFKSDLRKGDKIAIVYRQAYRNGYRMGYPEIDVAMIEVRGKPRYIYRNSDGRYYNSKGKQIEGFMLAKAIHKGRITSRFSRRRFHPILKRYRAHLGIDFGARSGTPVHAAASGRVIFRGRTRGYGNLIKIRHQDGYVTLYAHLKSFKKNVRRGTRVKQNRVIGYVGSTGLSTGPHLHFGLYKNGHARNPLGVLRFTSKVLKGKKKAAFEELKKGYNEEIAYHLKVESKPKIIEQPDNICYLGANNDIWNAKED
jgi:murein DD-endopeptidase MepM/ murein hydrolase activator NlpD